jgi:Domain of unknown function (DUF4832)
MKYLILGFICLVSAEQCRKPILNKADVVGDLVSITPAYYDRAFPNPLKGFRASSLKTEDYPTLTRLYITWNEIEQVETDGVEKIIAYCNREWQQLPRHNIKVIPRVYLEWPHKDQNDAHSRDTVTSDWGDTRYVDRYWPADLQRGDYTSHQFKNRLVKLIAKLGKAWDDDPRVAYVEMGLIGWWGEQHTPYINAEMQTLIGNAFTTAFKTKLVLVRQAKDFTSFNFGSYWDSFAHSSQQDEAAQLIAQGDKWKTSVRGGEVAYDWGDMTSTGTSPNASLSLVNSRDYLIDHIRKVHANHLGWINLYDSTQPGVSSGAAELQKNLGYRFVVHEVKYTPNVAASDSFFIQFTVSNIGSSPFYYNWPVEISLLDPATKIPRWKATVAGVDIRNWLPGDDWNTAQKKYLNAPAKNIVRGAFKLPADLQKGQYIVALSILDPAGNLPSVRFAIKNYFTGGRHPIGSMGINTMLSNYTLDASTFDDLYKDRTLHYDYN